MSRLCPGHQLDCQTGLLLQDLLPQHLREKVGHHVVLAYRVLGLQIGCRRGQSNDGFLPGCPNNCVLICIDLSCDQILHTCNVSHGYRPVETQGLLSKTTVKESEPQDDGKRNNKSEAVQVITDVATVRILHEPAASELLQVPRHRLHQSFICLPQQTLAESKMTLLVRVGWRRKKNTSFEIPKLLLSTHEQPR